MRREYEALNKLIGRNFAVLNDGMGVYLTPKGEIRDIDGRLLLPELEGRARLFERNLEESGNGGGGTSDAVQYIPQELTESQQMQARKNLGLAYRETEEKELVPETVITRPEEIPIISNPFSLELVVGRKYKVNWNGSIYECEAYQDSIFVGIGNRSIRSGGDNDAPDTGEPFFISYFAPANVTDVFTKINGSHTISISELAETTYTIPPEYMPGSLPFHVNVTYNADTSSYISDRTYAEIKEAETLKKAIVGTLTNENGNVYTLIGCDAAPSQVCKLVAFDIGKIPYLYFYGIAVSETGNVEVVPFSITATEEFE